MAIYVSTRRKFLRTISFLPIVPSAAWAGISTKKAAMPHIGFLSGGGALQLEKIFMDELKNLNYTNGVNIQPIITEATKVIR